MLKVTINEDCTLCPLALDVKVGEHVHFIFDAIATVNFSNSKFFMTLTPTPTYVSSISTAGHLQVDPNLAVGATNSVTVSAGAPTSYEIQTLDDCVIVVGTPTEISIAHGSTA